MKLLKEIISFIGHIVFVIPFLMVMYYVDNYLRNKRK